MENERTTKLIPTSFPRSSLFLSLPILPVLFLLLWKFVPLNYRSPTADDILSGLSGYHVSPGSDGERPVVPLRQRPFDPTKYEQKVAKCKAKERGTGWLFAKDKEVEIEIRESGREVGGREGGGRQTG